MVRFCYKWVYDCIMQCKVLLKETVIKKFGNNINETNYIINLRLL